MGAWKPARFGGSKPGPGNVNVLRGPNLESCTFWDLETCLETCGNRFGEPPSFCTFWGGPNLETCTFWGGPNLQTCKPARFGRSKPGNLHVSGAQTWKPARLGGPNLVTCHIRRVQNMRASVCLGLSGFLEPNRTEPKTHRTARNRNRRTNRTATNRRPANRNEPNRTGTLLESAYYHICGVYLG